MRIPELLRPYHNRHGQHRFCTRGHRMEMMHASGWYGWCHRCHSAETCQCPPWRAPWSALRRHAWGWKMKLRGEL